MTDQERRQRLAQTMIDDLADNVKRYGQIVQRAGLSAEGRRLVRASAERALDEATALRYGRKFQPTGNHGQREVRS